MSTAPRTTISDADSATLSFCITSPDSFYNGRWITLLEFDDTDDSCKAYYTRPGPFSASIYRWAVEHDKMASLTKQNALKERTVLGIIQKNDFNRFLSAFFKTETGPDQYFAVRFVHKLMVQGLVEAPVFQDLLDKKCQHKPENVEYYLDKGNMKMCRADKEFVKKELLESGFLTEEQQGWVEVDLGLEKLSLEDEDGWDVVSRSGAA